MEARFYHYFMLYPVTWGMGVSINKIYLWKPFSMKLFLSLSLICLLALTNIARAMEPGKAPRSYTGHFENILGTSMELKIRATSQEESEKAQKAVLHEISRMAAILSAYDPGSEFRRWEATSQKAVPISRELFEVLDLFDRWRIRTGGVLDASAEAITKVWKEAAIRQRVPTAAELDMAVARVKQAHWKLDSLHQTATHLSDVPLMLNSFVKSYIIRHAAEAGMAASKADAIIVNIGGDIVVTGNVMETVSVSDPKADAENDLPVDEITISNRAVATSGSYRRGEMIAGKWFSHIVDPRTGEPADGVISATVVAPDATDAGALATAFNVMSPSESAALARTLPGIEYLIITKAGVEIKSPGWSKLETDVRPKAVGLGPDFEMLVNLELNLPKEGAIKRPYVAVWVEDENHAAVRTISCWHGSDRYLPELRSWYLKYRTIYASDKGFSSSMTSATRSAGKYTVKWDGKDDNGNPVKPGKYIVKIEVSREHGTYQLMRQEIEWNDMAKTFNLTGNIEIAAASLELRKKSNGN